MSTRPVTAEFNALLASHEYRDHGDVLDLHPAQAERLALGLRWAKRRGMPVRVSRERFNAVGAPEPKSSLIRAEVQAPISVVEDALTRARLTLGPLTPRVRTLTVGAWLAGPHAGLRPVPGGRLETAALTLEAVLWSGEVYRSHPTPRAASGPDLDFALLGGNDAVGLLTSAQLRAFTLPTTVERVSLILDAPERAAVILADAMGHEAVPTSAELVREDGATVLTATFQGLAVRVHRDAQALRAAAALDGARVREPIAPPAQERVPAHELECGWDALPALLALAAPAGAALHRIARESVVLATPVELAGDGVVSLDAPAPTPPWLAALAQQLRGTP